jgi:hypothetical protein
VRPPPRNFPPPHEKQQLLTLTLKLAPGADGKQQKDLRGLINSLLGSTGRPKACKIRLNATHRLNILPPRAKLPQGETFSDGIACNCYFGDPSNIAAAAPVAAAPAGDYSSMIAPEPSAGGSDYSSMIPPDSSAGGSDYSSMIAPEPSAGGSDYSSMIPPDSSAGGSDYSSMIAPDSSGQGEKRPLQGNEHETDEEGLRKRARDVEAHYNKLNRSVRADNRFSLIWHMRKFNNWVKAMLVKQVTSRSRVYSLVHAHMRTHTQPPSRTYFHATLTCTLFAPSPVLRTGLCGRSWNSCARSCVREGGGP